MRRSDERPDPWSYTLRPIYGAILATLAVGFCGLMMFAYCASRPHELVVPIDTRTGEQAAFGIYLIDTRAQSGRTDPQTGAALHASMFNPNWPNCVVVAAWDDGSVVRSVGVRPEDAVVECVMSSPRNVASVRERLVAAMDDPSRPSEPPFVDLDTSKIVCFARAGDRYSKLVCSLSHANRERIEWDPGMVAYLEQWAACTAIAMDVIPTGGSTQVADWVAFRRDDK